MEINFSSEVTMQIAMVVVSTAAFLYIAGIISVTASKRWIPRYYDEMSDEDRWVWRSGFASIINSIILVSCSTYILLTENLRADVFWTDSLSTRLLSSFEIGYFISDSILLCWHDMQQKKLQYLAHHVFGVIGLGMTVVYKVFAFHTCLRFLQDVSTPFMNLRWAILTWKLKDSRAYIINGLIFVFTFFLCRIATMPLNYSTFLVGIQSNGYSRLPMICKFIHISISSLLDILNVYWFIFIMKGCVKHLTTRRKTP